MLEMSKMTIWTIQYQLYMLYYIFKDEDKIHKISHLAPVLKGELNIHLQKSKYQTICTLLDTETTSSLVLRHLTKKLRMTNSNKSTKWNTKTGIFEPNKICKIQFILPELDQNKIIE